MARSFPSYIARWAILSMWLCIALGMRTGTAHPIPLPTSHGFPAPDTTDAWTYLLPYIDDEPDAELLDLWQTWLDSPLDINHASADQLQQLPGLDLRQALQIVSYRGEHGPFITVDGLAQVPTLSAEALRMVRPFLRIGPDLKSDTTLSSSWWREQWQARGLLRTGRRVEQARGYTEATSVPYLGSPYRSVARMRAWNRHLDVGLTADKRPGEPLMWDPSARQYGADHVIGYARLQNRGRIRQLVVGSYQAAFGQGLALWTGPRFSSIYGSPRTLTRQGSGLRPYRGTNPHMYFRGVGATVRITPTVDATAFASHRNRDATLDTLSQSQTVVARSLRSTSLRRTDTERRYRRLLPTTHVGGHLQWQRPRLQVGLLGVYAHFGHPVIPTPRLDTRDAFAGQWTTHWSLMAQYTTSHNLSVFGEAALTGPSGSALVAGVHAPLGRAASIAMRGHYAHRRYDPMELGGVDGRGVAGERGLLARLSLTVHPHWTLYGTVQQLYVDIPQFRTTRPEVATRTAFSAHYDPHARFHLRVQGQWRANDVRTSITHPYGPTTPVHASRIQHNMRVHMRYAFTPEIRFSARTAWTRISHPESPETGSLLWIETDYAPHPRFSGNVRWTLFDTDGFESRLFAYEPDVRYGFSVPALFEQGQRAHALLRIMILESLHLETKYSVTAFTNRDVLGQGRDAIDSHRVRDWRVQLRWTL